MIVYSVEDRFLKYTAEDLLFFYLKKYLKNILSQIVFSTKYLTRSQNSFSAIFIYISHSI